MEIKGIHPYADKFPMLPEGELAELAESIEANGLRNAIVVTPSGLVLDGRNRLAACERAGIDPTTVEYDGDDLAEYVIDCNVTRRNMSTGARAMSTALVLVADGRRENGRWRRGSVQVGNDDSVNSTWGQRLKECGAVLDFKPDLAEQVINGTVALDAAYQQAKSIKDSAERDKIMAREQAKREREMAAADAAAEAKIVADLTQAGSKYVALIEDGTLTPKAAWSAYREDTRKEREAADRARQILKERFVSMGKALSTCSSWGGYADDVPLMDGFIPELAPGVAGYFELDHLRAAQQFINRLIEWKENQQ